MIAQLKNLEMNGFRSFHSSGSVALDANVVLIYGKNGSGKTSLMSAIEFAVTGEVHDLSRFTNDYPRCLRNVRSSGATEVKLTVTTPDGDGQIIRALDGRTASASGTLSFRKEMSRFFADRCYLSQARLSRLLELYQAVDGETSEQLLVRFIRELLGLDLLENITGGLYEAGDRRRLESACPSFARLKREESNVQLAIGESTSQLATASGLATNILSDMRRAIESMGDPAPDQKWDFGGIKSRCNQLFSGSITDTVSRMQEMQGRISRIAGFLSQSDMTGDVNARREQQEILARQGSRKNDLEQLLANGLQFDQGAFPQLASTLGALPSDVPVIRRISVAKTTCLHLIVEFDDDTKAKNDLERECSALNQNVESLKVKLQEVESRLGSASVNTKRGQFELLRSVVENIHGKECPVCGRDYSETGSGTLKDRVISEMSSLGLDIQKLETAAKERDETTRNLADTVKRLELATGKFKDLEQRVNRLKVPYQIAQTITTFVRENEQQQNELQILNDDLAATQARIKNLDIRLRQNEEVANGTKTLANELQIPEDGRPVELSNLVNFLSEEVKNRLETLEKRRAFEQNLKRQLEQAEVVCRNLEKVQKDLSENKAKSETISRKNESVDQHVRSARRLSQAAAAAKTKLLNQVFNDTLNTLWRNLYRRLALREDFVPQLSEPTLSRGKIQTHISGTMSGISPFVDFGSVSSLGNLNTAALSLFLALNLVERPKHQVLLLDDPVQNMDDMHVIQFASLLRAIAFQAKRQVVLAVHEKALFDYLALELGPSREGDSLALITVSHDDGNKGSHIQLDRRQWKEDAVRFGT